MNNATKNVNPSYNWLSTHFKTLFHPQYSLKPSGTINKHSNLFILNIHIFDLLPPKNFTHWTLYSTAINLRKKSHGCWGLLELEIIPFLRLAPCGLGYKPKALAASKGLRAPTFLSAQRPDGGRRTLGRTLEGERSAWERYGRGLTIRGILSLAGI